MPILLDHQLREQIPQDLLDFPAAFYCDELAGLPDRAGPMHWHPYLEIATAQSGVLDYQVGQEHALLEPGDSILVNQNILHGIRQVSGGAPDPLPIVVFRREDGQWDGVRQQIGAAYDALRQRPDCYELTVQRSLCGVLETVYRNLDALPKSEASRVQLNTQVRLQKMLSYIYRHYTETVTLAEIAGAANISRSEAGRCFQAYLRCSPVEALIRYRLQVARRLLQETTLTLQEISFACGFHSVNYFSRQFRARYGCSPGEKRNSG